MEAVDADGDGDAHFVLTSREGITSPGISVIDVKRSLRPRRLPERGDRIAAAGPVFRGSYGQRQIEAIELHVARRQGANRGAGCASRRLEAFDELAEALQAPADRAARGTGAAPRTAGSRPRCATLVDSRGGRRCPTPTATRSPRASSGSPPGLGPLEPLLSRSARWTR